MHVVGASWGLGTLERSAAGGGPPPEGNIGEEAGCGGEASEEDVVEVASFACAAVKVASSLGLQGPAAPLGAHPLLAASGGQGLQGLQSAEHATTVYHANLLAGSSGNVQAQLLQAVAGSSASALASMQASEASSLDLQAMQSMEWLFKKERIYLLAQFWQQVSASLYFLCASACPFDPFECDNFLIHPSRVSLFAAIFEPHSGDPESNRSNRAQRHRG